MICALRIVFSVGPVTTCAFQGASVTLPMETVWWIPSFSTVLVLSVVHINLSSREFFSVILSTRQLSCVLMQPFALAVCQEGHVVQGGITACAGEFCPSFACNVPGK